MNKQKQIQELSGKDFFPLRRVAYGKEDTPQDQREYKIDGLVGSPVGTLSEFEIYAKEKGFKGLRFYELDGSCRFQVFEEVEE